MYGSKRIYMGRKRDCDILTGFRMWGGKEMRKGMGGILRY